MAITTDAHYREVELPEYRSHPLIAALPPIESDDVIYRRLRTTLPVSDDERTALPHLRHKMCSRLKQFMFPLPEYVDIYRSIEDAILEGYLPKNPSTPTGQHYLHYIERDSTSTQPVTGSFQPAGQGLSIFGESGAGKTRGVERILQQFPQVICHSEFQGRALPLRQVSWLKIDCPDCASVWSFIAHIIDELDSVLGTDELSQTRFKPGNVAETRVLIERRLRSLWLGILVLDELQNLRIGNSKLRDQLLNVFLHIINRSGVPILFCGNQETKDLLQSTLRDARRAEGGGCDDLGSMHTAIWPEFVRALWRMQYTNTPTALTDELANQLYELSRGLPGFAVSIYRKAQELVIGSGEESLSVDILNEAYLAACPLSAPILEEISIDTGSPADATTGDQATDTETAENDAPNDEEQAEPDTIADVDRIQHPEFRHKLLNVRNNNYALPLGVDPHVWRSAADDPDPYAYLLEKREIATDLFSSDRIG